MVIIDTVVNTLFGGLTLDPAGMHCPAGDDAFVSSYYYVLKMQFKGIEVEKTLSVKVQNTVLTVQEIHSRIHLQYLTLHVIRRK